jgi:DNA repair protein RadD
MITPRWYQEESINAIYNYFMQGGKGNPIVALPTASGKSIIPAVFIERTLKQWSSQRFLVMVHSSKLVRQNADKLIEVWPEAPFGIYSAELKRRDTQDAIIFGTIQSMIKVAENFGHRDLIFVDENHLVSQDENSQYLRFFAIMRRINPNVRIIGLTATKFRMGQGLLTDDGLFTDIVYDMTTMEGFNRLLSEGHLCPLIPKRTKTELDVSNVGIQKGEFIASQLEHEVDKAEVTWAALQEAVYYGKQRNSWMIFASGISHSNHIAEMLNKLGIECASVHSKQDSKYNDSALAAHKNGELKSIVSFSKLTTGLDHPMIDFMIDLQPTLSVVRHIQKYGRPMRTHPSKINSLCLDFARNIPRLGPVNSPIIPRKKGDKGGDVPIKICECCGVYAHISARVCENCGNLFTFEVKFKGSAGTDELIKTDETTPIIESFDVNYVIYKKHEKADKPPSIKATYFSGTTAFSEYVLLEHGGMAKHRAHEWWRQRSISEPPKTVDEALGHTSDLRKPRRVRVHTNKRYPEILGVEF